ncbi:porin family protein [Lacihabitans soyangensis]|uniref:PorT family protein n=1 Tax=Lacihabitans soyangensis TaxID=869394 RepID=A0AAE3H8V5_9BACT|nr:porin family protein [Lacihabitans soyangensis]MCP9765525.1 PorT family protein [Lacihabitans soyangensis]
MSKIKLIIVSILFIQVGILKAQTLSVGPVVGVNFSTFSGPTNTKFLPGVALGAFANYSVNEHVGIGAKFIYSQLGTDYKNVDYINRLHYLQMPITAIYYFGEVGDKFRPKIFGGPYIGTLLGATLKEGVKITEANGGPVYKKLDVGALVGVGFNYRIQDRTWLNLDAGFSQGFADVNESPTASFKNQSFGLNVGVSFPIK